ncbi:MAG: prepilin-type N-terminal cleavage/methylation domain-containing protein [Chthoniobacteraceae bacterium]|nr:prepilin-type N-terminal cleavage/methylation domain-containing protein [Chthoniobacteraceae bacterium]
MLPRPPFVSSRSRALQGARTGFTLIELLVVAAIIVILLALAVPALSTKKAADLSNATYEIQGALEMARSYAVANHTYTWVGFFEEDASKPSAQPAASGIGRVVIVTVASRDGTSIFNEAAAETTGTSLPSVQPLRGSGLVQVGKPIKLENIHICTPRNTSAAFTNRPGNLLEAKDRVGLSNGGDPLLFTFQYPLNSPSAQYTFGIRPAPVKNGLAAPSGIVMFNPQGEAISDTGPVPGVATCKEIAIQTTHGTAPDPGTNAAAIDINGLTGQATIYRP